MTGYANGMIDTHAAPVDADSVESLFRDGLASGDSVAESVVPILRHVLSSEDSSLFSDEIVARIRGMLRDLAAQLLARPDAGPAEGPGSEPDDAKIAQLSELLIGNAALVGHLHALALEWQLTERLQRRLGTDPVLTPLVQALIASPDKETSALAMRFLASQARHCQSQRRMTLALLELPGDLLHAAVMAMRTLGSEDTDEDARAAAQEAAIRKDFDEATTRLGIMTRLIMGMGSGAVSALSIAHSGVAMFLSALATGSGMERDLAALSTHEGQAARLALALRSSGLRPDSVKEQCLALHPALDLPPGFECIGPDRAAALLAAGGGYSGE